METAEQEVKSPTNVDAKPNRKALIAACLAILAVLAVATTVAYLSSVSTPVVNTFSRNNVTVTLTETTGQSYSIIPGTSQKKDPTVHVNASLDAYVYVIVKDTTNGAVSYSIDGGWTELTSSDLKETPAEGIDISGSGISVFYREASAGADVSFPVLANNTVTYSDSAGGSSSSDEVTLTFTAYAIQKSPFNDPVKAWNQEFARGPDPGAPAATVTAATISDNGIDIADETTDLLENFGVDIKPFTFKPTHAMTFELGEDPIENEQYKDWDVDFVVSFDQDVKGADLSGSDTNSMHFGQVLMYGTYGSYGNIPMVVWNDLPAGQEYRLLKDGMKGRNVKYYELKTMGISPFTCGATVKKTDDEFYSTTEKDGKAEGVKAVYANGLLPLTSDLTMSISLKLFNPDDDSDSVTCAPMTYTLPAD